MNDDHIKELLLLIEDNEAVAERILGALVRVKDAFYRVERVRRLSEGIERLRAGGIVAVLVDLFLPDSSGSQTLDKIVLAAPDIPILVLTDGDETIATQVARPDYLLKDYFNTYTLHRALRSVNAWGCGWLLMTSAPAIAASAT